MKKIVGLILFVVVLLGAGCSGKTTGESTGNETTPSPKALPVKKVNCIELPKQVPGASNVRFEVSENCALDHPVRIDKDNIVIVGNGVTLIPNDDNAESLDGFIVSSRNVIIDGFNFRGFDVPIVVSQSARAIVSNISITAAKAAGIAVTRPPAPQPPPVLLKWIPSFDSFEWMATAHAASCNGITGESLCAVARRVIEDFGALSLGADCPQLTLCGQVAVTATVPDSSAIYVGNASTLDNRAKLSITVDSPPPKAKGLNISGSTVNLRQETNINNSAGWAVYFDDRGGTLNVNAETGIGDMTAVHCGQGAITGRKAPRALSSRCSSDDD